MGKEHCFKCQEDFDIDIKDYYYGLEGSKHPYNLGCIDAAHEPRIQWLCPVCDISHKITDVKDEEKIWKKIDVSPGCLLL